METSVGSHRLSRVINSNSKVRKVSLPDGRARSNKSTGNPGTLAGILDNGCPMTSIVVQPKRSRADWLQKTGMPFASRINNGGSAWAGVESATPKTRFQISGSRLETG